MNSKVQIIDNQICFIRKYTHWRSIKMFQIFEYNSLRIPFRQIKNEAAKKRKSDLANLKSQKQMSKRIGFEVTIPKENQKRISLALYVQFPKEYTHDAYVLKKEKSETIVDLFNVQKKKNLRADKNKVTPIQAQNRTSLINTRNYLSQPFECIKNETESRLVQDIRLIQENSRINQIQKVEIFENQSLNDYLAIIDEIRSQKLLMKKQGQKQNPGNLPIKRRPNILPIYLLCLFVFISTCLRWL